MAAGARARGEDVVVWNRTLSKAHALASLGVRVAETPEEAVRGASRVHLALSDDAAVDDVLARVLASGTVPVVVDHSTTSPHGTAQRAARLAAAGQSFAHAPIFMSPQGARDAKGIMLCSAPAATFGAIESALRAMTGDLWYLGERADLAAAYKLFGNAMIVTITAGLADVFAMARALDLPAETAHALFSRFKPAGTIDVRGARMARGEFSATFELAMARKDVRLMLETAAHTADPRPLTVLPAIAARMDEMIATGLGGEDLGVLAKGALEGRGRS
jgi:3-hydroxyisobutyrate dehydrogenase-like beta-hydroxyacid dehydrogenase